VLFFRSQKNNKNSLIIEYDKKAARLRGCRGRGEIRKTGKGTNTTTTGTGHIQLNGKKAGDTRGKFAAAVY